MSILEKDSESQQRAKRLVFRLSSLGDVILSTSVLSTAWGASGVDWVVGQEFSGVLAEHPKIGKLWRFNRKSGILGWWKLCQQLHTQGYSEVWDLHCTLRTRLARIFFFVIDLRAALKNRAPLASRSWMTLSKPRVQLYGLLVFKKYWPRRWQPGRYVERFARFVGGAGDERPNLGFLTELPQSPESLPLEILRDSPYYCVMPGSKWKGKRWQANKYFEVIQKLKVLPVILGSPSDAEAVELCSMLNQASIRFISGVGVWTLPQVARVLAGSIGYLGNDTGLAHLAEAVGVPAFVVFGPTAPEMGFSPWRQESRSLGMPLWCRPCNKEGRRCYRPGQKYLCMTSLTSENVAFQFQGLIQARRRHAILQGQE